MLSAAYARRDGDARGALSAHGCPLQAIVAAFGIHARSVAAWLTHPGLHSQAVHEHLVQTPRDLGQVQATEIRVRKQGGAVGMALALIRRLLARVRACALPGVLLCCADGWCADLHAMRTTFRDAVRTGARGRPRRRGWSSLLSAQVVTWYKQRRMIAGERRSVPPHGLSSCSTARKATR